MAWVDRLNADQENIRAALRWSVEHQRPEPGLAIVGALWIWYWLSFREGRASAEAVLGLAGADVPSPRRAKALFMASLMAWGEGDGPAFERFGQEGVAVSRAIGSPERLAYALSIYATNRPGARDGLHAHYAECLEAAHAAGTPWLLAWVHMCYAVAAAQVGDPPTACRQGREAVERFRQLHDAWMTAISAMPLGLGLLQLAQLEQAEAALREALPVFRQVRDPKWTDTSLLALGLIARQRGDVDAMARAYAEAVVLCRDAGDTGNVSLALEGLAAVAAARGSWEQAARLLGAAEAARSLGGQPTIPAYEQLYPTTVTAVRAALAEAAFTGAWNAGQRLELDEAVTEGRALAAARPMPPPGSAAHGGRLSAREQEVLRLLAGGYTSREIAAALVLSSHTVERHVANVYTKIGARRRADAVAYAFQHGLIQAPVA
jgi:DNA-binding CsgD family transcriptional regulator